MSSFKSAWPSRDGRTITIAEVLDRSTRELQEKFPDDPRTKAALLGAIGSSYEQLGLDAEAIPLLEQARDLRTRLTTRRSRIAQVSQLVGFRLSMRGAN